MTDLRYPIGPFTYDPASAESLRAGRLLAIEQAPGLLAKAVSGLGDARLDTPYRDGGWTVRQVVHHLADSHMHSYIRMKFAIAETNPQVRPYHENRWAEMSDARTADVATSLALLEALHRRWVLWLRALGPEDWPRTFLHPENGEISLDRALAYYAWHGRQHTAHVTGLRQRMGW
jgi:hypothetical protein